VVMLLTRLDEIFRREGFMVEVTRNGKSLKDLRRNGVLNPYEFKRKLKDSKTVREWIEERFESTNPRYSCRVLKGDGTVAIGQTQLGTVRATY